MQHQRYDDGARPLPRKLHRTFFAIAFTREVTAYLAGLIERFKAHGADVHWVPERNIHLTLRFLGEITDQQLGHALELLADADIELPIALRASGLGTFPSLRAPRVIWAGVDGATSDDRRRLAAAQEMTEEWARAIGLVPERRRYMPHVTLGRVGHASPGLRPLVDEITTAACSSPFTMIDRVVLIRSELGPGGSRYVVLAESKRARAGG